MTNQIQEPGVFKEKPQNFAASAYVTAAYVEVHGLILLLQLSKEKSEPGKWGVPAGKLEKNETPEQGVVRELFEETGIKIEKETPVISLGELYIQKPTIDYVYHLFRIKLDTLPASITLSSEHVAYKWVSFEEMLKLPLMDGALSALHFYAESII